MGKDTSNSGKSFDQRLQEARTRQGLDAQPIRTGQPAPEFSAMSAFFRVGIELVSALVVGLAIGWGLDRLLGTKPLFLILFVLLGGVAGIINVWRQVAPAPTPGRKS